MNKLDRIGEIQYNFYRNKMTIIEYFNANNITVQFEDGYIINNVIYSNFKKGTLKSPYDKSIYNIGYIGEGKHKIRMEGKITKQYLTWRSMLLRCYDNQFHKKENTYVSCTVCDEWHNFQVFAEWYNENYYTINEEQMTLDKDILIKGNKVYSPQTCVFVPQSINSLFTKTDALRGKYPIGVWLHKQNNKFETGCNDGNGKQKYLGLFDTPEDAFYKGYKPYKEKIIKQVADKYKEKIPQRLYDAIYCYEVEITD